jgi:hypothetical protein
VSRRPALRPGDVLAGRYRLIERVSTGDVTTLWRAADDVLARSVAVRLLPADGRRAAAADRFLDAAAEAGAVDLPVFARVFDAALEERPAEVPLSVGGTRRAGSLDVAYVIREWVPGRPLDEALRADGPLDPATARDLVADAARGLAVAASRGVAHGRLHPGNLVLTPDGRLRVLDLGVAGALPAAPAADLAGDTRDLGAVLYALLTARWPASATDAPPGGLAAAPQRDGAPQRPGQLARAVPRALDELVTGVLAGRPGAPTTPGELARALDRMDPDEVRAERRARLSPAARRRLPAAVVVGVLLAVGLTSYVVGRQVGAVEAEDDAFEALVEPSAPAPGGDGSVGSACCGPVDLLSEAQVTDFDPPPGDGRESPGAVPNAFDGDPSTAWETERYATPEFGGLKDGVGLLVDLGAPTSIAAVELGLRPGTQVELRAADEAGATIEAFPLVAAGGGEQVVRLDAGRTARYWLVALTGLPADGGRFRGGIAELVFLRG